MKFLSLLTILLSMWGCPDGGTGEEMEIETRITHNQFRNELGQLEISYDSNIDDARFQCQVTLTGGSNARNDQNPPYVHATRIKGGSNAHNDQSWSTCTSNPLRIPMTVGERLELRVRAIADDNRVDVTPQVFTYVHSTNTGTGVSHMLQPPVFQIGIAYEFTVPEGMHITQYASNNNYQGAGIELVRLQQGQSYDSLGSYPLQALGGNGCSTFAQGIVALKNPSGRVYNYCRSFLDVGNYFNLFSSNYARNHIEVASDNHFNEMQLNSKPQSRLLVQTYGPQEETMIRNRFNDLCHPSRVIKPVSRFHGVPMAQGFWLADELTVRDTYVCTVKLGGLSGGFYQVGGFTAVTRINDSHHEIGCSEGSCGGYAKFISVVYMERIAGENGIDQNFARNFQQTLLSSLRRNRP